MLAEQKNTNTGMVPVDHVIAFNQPQQQLLAYQPQEPTCKRKVTGGDAPKARKHISSIGLVIPFCPCIWDDKTIHATWNNTLQRVKKIMKEKYSTECTDKTIARLQKIFKKLNFDTHRKSLAVTLAPEEEKIIYLNFPVKPVVFFRGSVSTFDLAANLHKEPDFYYLVLDNDGVNLYDYNNKRLRPVYKASSEINTAGVFKKACIVIELLNGKQEKPVFVTGIPNLVEQFCKSKLYAENYFPLLYHKAPFSSEIFQTLLKEITRHWSYWLSKFIAVSVILAQKTNGLISHTEAVLQALRKGADGLLLIDKRLKRQLQKPVSGNTLFTIADEFISQFEQFLARGNRFEITKTGLLRDFGGIVLLRHTSPVISELQVSQPRNEAPSVGELF